MTKRYKLVIGMWALCAVLWASFAVMNFRAGNIWLGGLDVIITFLAGANVYMMWKNEKLRQSIKKAEQEIFSRMEKVLDNIEEKNDR